MRRPAHLRARSIDAHQAGPVGVGSICVPFICAFLWVGVGLSGCSFDARDCTLGTPCPSDQVCDSATGVCEPVDADGSNRADANQPDADQPKDAAGADPDSGPDDPFDAPPVDPDASPYDGDPLGGECLVDPISYTCSQDSHEPNDDALNATDLSSDSIGCDHRTEELVSFDTQRRATLCPNDQDWYRYQVRTCRARSFIVEVYVTPDKECDPRSYALEWRVDDDLEARCIDPARDGTSRWQCQALEGGGKKLAYIVDSERYQGVDTHEITVLTSELVDDQAAQFDYTIRVRLKP